MTYVIKNTYIAHKMNQIYVNHKKNPWNYHIQPFMGYVFVNVLMLVKSGLLTIVNWYSWSKWTVKYCQIKVWFGEICGFPEIA